MKTKKILKTLKTIEDLLPPRTDGIFAEHFVYIKIYSDGSGGVENENIRLFSFGENFKGFMEAFAIWVITK